MIVTLLLFFLPLSAPQSVCIQFIEKCGETVIEVERQLIQHRTHAFSQCVDSAICAEERRVFDTCFLESFRAKTSSAEPNQFSQTFADYRQGLTNCLEMSAVTDSEASAQPVQNEIAWMTRLLYESEMGDQVWSLKDGDEMRSIQVEGLCKKSTLGRLFGAGINRLVRNSDPKLNNLASSCVLEDSQISCYHSLLRYNLQYMHLLDRRDSMLTQCLDSIPITCVTSTASSSCLCAARIGFERRMSLDLLRCVLDSPMAIDYTRRVAENVLKSRSFGGKHEVFPIANITFEKKPEIEMEIEQEEVPDTPKQARELNWKPSSSPLGTLLPLNRPLLLN